MTPSKSFGHPVDLTPAGRVPVRSRGLISAFPGDEHSTQPAHDFGARVSRLSLASVVIFTLALWSLVILVARTIV